MEVRINVFGDYAQILRKRLTDNIGYSKSSVDSIQDDDGIVLTYFRVLRRLVSNVPRAIFKAEGFVCPPEHVDALAQIERKIRNGESIVPYLSRRVLDVSYNDALLNDWGIQHLHLGTSMSNKPKHRGLLIEDTKELLYVYISLDSVHTSLRYLGMVLILRIKYWSKQSTTIGRKSWSNTEIRISFPCIRKI